MNDQEDETEQMRFALAAIANELQKIFQNELLPSDEEQKDDDDFVLKYKRSLKLKKDQIKVLKDNLKLACTVAKTLSAAKTNEMAILKNELKCARNQYWDLVKQDKEKTNTVNMLKAENQTLQDKLKCFNNFIHLGYQELQNIRNKSTENISSLKQLQTIVSCCSEYYADHHNKFEKCAQLEQKNRFLTSKLRILESQLETALEELNNLRTKKIYREKEEILTKNRQCKNIGIVCSEYLIGYQNKAQNFPITNRDLSKETSRDNKGNLDLTRHLSTVRKLLLDQDTLIKDLKCLSKEINSDIFMT